MSRKRITAAHYASTVRLPQEIIEMMGVEAGDEVDVSVVNRTLILRPLDEAERAETIGSVTKAVFERRKTAYEELAKGVE